MKLSTGKIFRVGGAGNETIGISADLEVTEGYDHPNDQWMGDLWADDWLTVAEKIEVCEVMKARWDALKNQLLGQ